MFSGKSATAVLAAFAALAVTPASAENWVRAFAVAPIAEQAVIVSPPIYESALEKDVRILVEEALAARGFQIATGGADDALQLSVSVDVKHAAPRSLPKSPVQLVRDDTRDTAPLDTRYNRHVAANASGFDIEISDPAPRRLSGPSVSLAITILDGETRAWQGQAAADLGPATRSATSRALARALMDAFGESIAAENVALEFDDAPDFVQLIELGADD